MNNFKQKALISALAGAGALAMAGAANAVYVNQDGLGQALVYPYYTVRGGNVTLVSVVNTTTQAKAVKVRFLEGKNSREVLDFNLFLSAKDVWTGLITPTANGASVSTNDRSCTNPKLPAAGVEFRNGLLVADGDANATLDRTREGYVEIIEMATIPNASPLGVAVTHVLGTAPCTPARINDAGFAASIGTLLPQSGGLFGNGTILNILGGASTGYEATAFDGLYTRPQPTNSGSLFPNLSTGTSFVSVVNNNGNVYVANWAASIDAVSATIMHSAVYGEYAYTTDKVIGTDWVITMPTKNQYVFPTFVIAPFQSPYNTATSMSCDDVSLFSYDREEVTSLTPDDFSPRPPNGRNQLCFEANVISFGGISVLASTNSVNINPIQNGGVAVATAGGEGGWLELGFNAPTAKLSTPDGSITTTSSGRPVTTVGPQTYVGLPTVGFVYSGALFKTGNPQQNYANSYALRFGRTIQ